MHHKDVINIISNNEAIFATVYEDFQNLEASCEFIATSNQDELDYYIDMMKNSLLTFKSSKCRLLELAYISDVPDALPEES